MMVSPHLQKSDRYSSFLFHPLFLIISYIAINHPCNDQPEPCRRTAEPCCKKCKSQIHCNLSIKKIYNRVITFFNNINNDLCHNTNKQSYHKYSNDSKIIISIIKHCKRCQFGYWSDRPLPEPDLALQISIPLMTQTGITSAGHKKISADFSPDSQNYRSYWQYRYTAGSETPAYVYISF